MAGTGIQWKRISAEGFAIVVSILLAFGIDAWWEEFQEAREERVLLENLAAEIDVVRASVEAAMDGQRPVPLWVERFTHFDESTPLDSVALALREVFAYYTPQLEISSVNSVLATGTLDDLRTEGLAEWIVAWPVEAEDLMEDGETIRKYVHEVLAPYFAERGIPRTPIYRDLGVPGVVFGESIPLEAIRPVVGDYGFDAVLNHAAFINYNFIGEAALTLEVLDEGREIVRRGLER